MGELRVLYQPHNTYDPWAALGSAVLKLAAYDYLRYGRKLLVCEDEEKKQLLSAEMKNLTRFFLSDWYEVLGGENGAEVLAQLDEEVFGEDECT